MRKLFHEEYNDMLNQIRSTLLRYHIEFEQLKNQALNDYREGKILEGGYKFATSKKISDYYTVNGGKKAEYCLSKEQVEFIKKYAQLDANGDMLLDSLKPEFVLKGKKLNTIFESIRTFQFFDNLSLDDLRKIMAQIIGDNYDNSAKIVEEAKENGASEVELDGKLFKSELFDIVIGKLQLHKAQAVDRIGISSKEDLINLIEQYYDVNYSYYTWFRTKKLQEDSQDVDIALDHEKRIMMVEYRHGVLQEKVLDYQNMVDEANNVSSDYYQFMNAVMVINDDKVSGQKRERFVGKLFHKKDNLAKLRGLFEILKNLPGVSRYLNTFSCSDVFQEFMNSNYPGITYLSQDDFKKAFVSRVNEYYLTTLTKLGKELQSSKDLISKCESELTDDISIAQEEAAYRTLMIRSLGSTPKLEGMMVVEEETIFADMKEYFANEPELRYYVAEMRRKDELRTSKKCTK